MSIVLKKRGRPSKADIAARVAASIPSVVIERSPEEILADLKERFNILSLLTQGAVHSNIRAVTVTGAPGIGKTYTVERILERANATLGTQYEIVRGTLSAVNLYMLGYRMRKPNSVIVLDDADSIFNDEDALNILKVLCDSSDVRRVSWLKESNALKEEDIPTSYEFDGSIIFISNLNFQQFVDEGRNKYAQHFEALMSRSLYLDLQLHDRAEVGVWVEHTATNGRILEREGLSYEQMDNVLRFVREHRDQLRELSLRTVLKAAQLVKAHPVNWESMAKILLLKH